MADRAVMQEALKAGMILALRAPFIVVLSCFGAGLKYTAKPQDHLSKSKAARVFKRTAPSGF